MSFSHLSFILICLHVQVFIFLDLSRTSSFSPPHRRQLFIGPILLNIIAPLNIVRPCFQCRPLSLCVFCNIDVPDSRYDCVDHCCDKDVPLTCKLLFCRHVRSFSRLYSTLNIVDDCASSQDIPQTHVMSSIQRVSCGSFPLNRVEIDEHTDSGQYLDSQEYHYGSYTGTDTDVCAETHRLGIEGDIEIGRNKMMTAG